MIECLDELLIRNKDKAALEQRLVKEFELLTVELAQVNTSNGIWEYLDVKLYFDKRTRVSFRIHELAGSCCWVVMSYLSNHPPHLKVQLRATEILAREAYYGGILVTQINFYPISCVQVLKAEDYTMVGEVYNPHSENSNYVFLKVLQESEHPFHSRYFYGTL